MMGVRPSSKNQEISILRTTLDLHHNPSHPLSAFALTPNTPTSWNVIDADWFSLWERPSYPPAEISNSLLMLPQSILMRPGLSFQKHYRVLPPLAYSALESWYGGGPSIFRLMTQDATGDPVVELYVRTRARASPPTESAEEEN
jgi:hypothetical protein